MEKQEEPMVDPMTAALKKIDSTVYVPLERYGWDQSGQKVKVYVTSGVDGIGKIPKDNISCEFEDQSFDLRIQGLNGKNFRLRIAPLQHPIDLAKCSFNVKSNGVSITLYKQDKLEHWTDLKPKQSLISEKKGKSEDSEAGAMGDLMNMMKEMYQNGDDKTKQMIAESWTKS